MIKIPFTNKQLAKFATYGAFFVAGNAILMQYLVNKRFHESPYFIPAAKLLLEHKPLVNYLGEPVKFGNPNLSDNTTNFSTEHQAQFEVPLKGSKTGGMMKFTAIRKETEGWKVNSLEVMVDDRPNEKVVLVKES